MASLATERLTLRPMCEGDLDVFAAVSADEAVARHIGGAVSRAACVEKLARLTRQWREQGYGWWGARERDTLVGWVGFREEPYGPAEIGWILRSGHWGRGLATEAAAAVIAYGFGALGFPAITCLIRPENAASLRLARRLGFVHVETLEVNGRVQVVFRREG
jgi:RimJ/RimL family protein N-acetyltransferase